MNFPLRSLLLVASWLAAALAQAESPEWRYTVQPGDNLYALGEGYLAQPGKWTEIQTLNRVADPLHLTPGTVLRIPLHLLRKEWGKVKVQSVQGQARWQMPEGSWQSLAAGDTLPSGALIETGEDSHVLLALEDRTGIALRPNTQLSLDKLGLYLRGVMRDSHIRLLRGESEILANPGKARRYRFTVETPSAQSVVRGTRFRVALENNGSTREETLEGGVEVGAQRRYVLVARAQGTRIQAGGQPLPPQPLLAAPALHGYPATVEFLPLHLPLSLPPGAQSWSADLRAGEAASGLGAVLIQREGRAEGAITLADLPNGRYTLHLRGIDQQGLEGMDGEHTFTVFARPFPPTLNAPGNGAKIRTPRPTLAWAEAVDIPRYRIQLAENPDFTTLLADETRSDHQLAVAADLPPGPYFWRAASINERGEQGPWQRVSRFDYVPSPAPAEAGEGAISVAGLQVSAQLGAPPTGLVYEVFLSTNPQGEKPLAVARGSTEAALLTLQAPARGRYYVGLRRLDPSDGTPGPAFIQAVDAGGASPWWLLLALPLL